MPYRFAKCYRTAPNIYVRYLGMSKIRLPWRDAASLIITAPKLPANKFNYNVLLMKRASKSSFFPNSYVFPGGVIDNADKSSKWFEIFKGVDPDFVSRIPEEFFIKQTDGKRSPLFPGDVKSLETGVLPNEIAFRICAIRESFEESGILLVTDNVDFRNENSGEIRAISREDLLDNSALKKWRHKVHSNAYEFLNLCTELKCVPDVWSLKEWYEWLTPIVPGSTNPKRYDTVFYSCCLKKAPQNVSHDNAEMAESIWCSPEEMIKMYAEKEVFLPPPQVFELLKMMNFSLLSSLHKYAAKRGSKGMMRTMLCFLMTSDGKTLSVMPGDDLYPKDPDEGGEKTEAFKVDETFDEIKSTPRRFRFIPMKIFMMDCNIIPDYGVLNPVNVANGKWSLDVLSKL